MKPDLASYDVILVSSSAGKDSQALLDVVVELATAAGVRDRLVVVHADLGRVEWQGTRELAEEQARHYGLRFEVVKRPQGDLLQQVRQRGMWPSSDCRYCTSDHKRGQIDKLLTALVREKAHLGRPVRILNCMGLRAEESPARRKKLPFEHNARASNGKRHVDNWLPIHDWTETQVWERIRRAGTRVHPAYALGMSRLSCVLCIFAPKRELMIAARHNPDLFQEYIQVETEIGHRFRNDLALTDVAAALARGETASATSAAWNM